MNLLTVYILHIMKLKLIIIYSEKKVTVLQNWLKAQVWS